jgi:hypothetical protein
VDVRHFRVAAVPGSSPPPISMRRVLPSLF